MLYFNRIDVNKTSVSKECDICHYWYFFHYSFKFQSNVCKRCHDLLMSMSFSAIAFLNIKDSDYRCILSSITKNKVTNQRQSVDLTEKSETL